MIKTARDFVGGLVMLVAGAAASVPYQVKAEERELDCSAKTYYALKKQAVVKGDSPVEQLFYLVNASPTKMITRTYMGSKGTKEGQFKAEDKSDDYGDEHTLSFIVEYEAEGYLTPEIDVVEVQYEVQQKPDKAGKLHNEFILRRFVSSDPKGREMYPYYVAGEDIPDVDGAVAGIFASKYSTNIVKSYLIDARKGVSMCNAQRGSDLRTLSTALGVAQDEIDAALGIKKEQDKEESKKKEEPKKTEKDKSKPKK